MCSDLSRDYVALFSFPAALVHVGPELVGLPGRNLQKVLDYKKNVVILHPLKKG